MSKTEELLEDLELVEVVYGSNNQSAELTFLDREAGEIHTVNFNKQVFDETNRTWHDDEERAEYIEKKALDVVGKDFDHLTNAIGEKFNVYSYPTFDSLTPVDVVEKFAEDDRDEIIMTTIDDVVVTDQMISVRFKWDDEHPGTYQSRFSFQKYLQSTGQYYTDPKKKNKQEAKFKKLFGVPSSQASTLIGKKITVIVEAFGGHGYGTIKKVG